MIPGNHDISMTGVNIEKQPISVLGESGSCLLLGHPFTKESFATFGNVSVFGVGYSDSNEKFNDIFNEPPPKDTFSVLAIHQTLLPDGDSFFGDFMNFHEFKDCPYSMIACGHYHPGFKPAVVSAHGKFFVNPGAISRGSIDSHNLERVPSFQVVTVSDIRSVTSETVYIPAESADKIFDLHKVEQSKVSKKDMADFAISIKEVISEQVDVSSVDGILELMSSIGATKEILNFSKPYLEMAKEGLSA